ncbi:MAG: phosphatidylglycerophosphatase A [Gammaproteobacteria bacterium]|nr:phosphatidylglycerophosphatase A [Gammaproteobacteria bacterium]QOJ31209.1 MAG: phosphatidylglycerophosphatase A [Gammaproteobacteria bacterium]
MPLPPDRSLPREVLRHPVHWLPFGLGAGLLPWAPGTWGSLLAVMLFWLLPPLEPLLHLGLAAAGFVLGVGLCGLSARRLGVHDHPGIVLDEIVAMWATLAAVPRAALWCGLAFIAFRVMDIWKPWPIREADHRIPGGLGIMLDDALAAAFAAAVVSSLWKLSESLY